MDHLIENSYAPVDIESEKEGVAAFALFVNRKEADLAVAALQRNGYAPADISLLAPQQSGHHDFVYHQPPSLLMGSSIGGLFGLMLLGFAGLLFGQTMTALVFSLIGLIVGAGIGVLVGIGTPKSAAKRYGFYLKEGGIVLVVHLKNESEKDSVHRILEKTRGQDINVLDESKIWSTIIPEKKRLVFQ